MGNNIIIVLGRTPSLKKIVIACAKLVPVLNCIIEFKTAKTWRKGGMLLIFLMNQT